MEPSPTVTVTVNYIWEKIRETPEFWIAQFAGGSMILVYLFSSLVNNVYSSLFFVLAMGFYFILIALLLLFFVSTVARLLFWITKPERVAKLWIVSGVAITVIIIFVFVLLFQLLDAKGFLFWLLSRLSLVLLGISIAVFCISLISSFIAFAKKTSRKKVGSL